MKTEKPFHAIVVDDDHTQAKGVAAQLERWGFACKFFNRWDGAKAALEESTKTDLLVIDNALKQGKSGIQLAADFLSSGKTPPSKLLVLTGYASSLTLADQTAADKWGMQVEAKPPDFQRIMKKLFPTAVNAIPSQPIERPSAMKRFRTWCNEHAGIAAICGVPLAVVGLWLAYLALKPATGENHNSTTGQPLTPIKVRVAVNPVPLGALPIIAEKVGHWKEFGLEVDLISFPTGKASLDAVLGGGAEFATAAETPIMRAGLAGHTPAVIATIASSADDCKVCYRPDHGIAKPSDLRGKKVATAFGTSAEYFMDAFLRHNGIRRDEVTALNMKPAEMVNTLNRGDISAFFIWEPYPLEAGKLLKGNTGIFLGGGIYTETFQIVTRRDYAQANSEACQRLIRALLAAEHHAETKEQDAAEKVAAFTQLAPADVSVIWKNFQFRVALNQDLVSLLENQATWARVSDPTLPANFVFQSLIWPEPLSKVANNRVTLNP